MKAMKTSEAADLIEQSLHILYPKIKDNPGGTELGGVYWRLNSLLSLYVNPRLELDKLHEEVDMLNTAIEYCIANIKHMIDKEYCLKIEDDMKKLHDAYHAHYFGYMKLIKK